MRAPYSTTSSAPLPVDATPDELQPYLGRYTAQLADRVLSLRDGNLWLESIPHGGFPLPDTPASATPPPVRAVLLDSDTLLALDPPFEGTRGEFLRDTDGTIAWLRFGSRIHARVR